MLVSVSIGLDYTFEIKIREYDNQVESIKMQNVKMNDKTFGITTYTYLYGETPPNKKEKQGISMRLKRMENKMSR